MSWLGIWRLHDWVYRDLFFGSDVCLQWFGVWAGEQKESPHLRSPRGVRVGGGRCEVSSMDEEASLALAEELAEGLLGPGTAAGPHLPARNGVRHGDDAENRTIHHDGDIRC